MQRVVEDQEGRREGSHYRPQNQAREAQHLNLPAEDQIQEAVGAEKNTKAQAHGDRRHQHPQGQQHHQDVFAPDRRRVQQIGRNQRQGSGDHRRYRRVKQRIQHRFPEGGILQDVVPVGTGHVEGQRQHRQDREQQDAADGNHAQPLMAYFSDHAHLS